MFKLFIAAYLVATGQYAAGGASLQTYSTREECIQVMLSKEAGSHGAAYVQAEISKRLGKEVSVKATCEKVDDNGVSEERL